MTNDPNDDFDWVSAQSGCTAEAMFDRLRKGAQRDVEKRNSLGGADDVRYELHDEEDQFEVSRVAASSFSTPKTLAFVTFTREGRRIIVAGDGVDVDFTAIVAVNDVGVCHFFVGEIEYAEWQVRKLALEHLFFDEAEE